MQNLLFFLNCETIKFIKGLPKDLLATARKKKGKTVKLQVL